MVLRRTKKHSSDDQALLTVLRPHAPELGEVIALAEAFTGLIPDHASSRLDPWLQRARENTAGQIRSFAEGLLDDYDPIRAAVETTWMLRDSKFDQSSKVSRHNLEQRANAWPYYAGLRPLA